MSLTLFSFSKVTPVFFNSRIRSARRSLTAVDKWRETKGDPTAFPSSYKEKKEVSLLPFPIGCRTGS